MIEILQRRWHRLWQKLPPDRGPLGPVTMLEDDPSVRALRTTAPTLEAILRESILPFWEEKALDFQHGGYLLNHDQDGEWKGPADKFCIPQARVVWFFSRAFRAGFFPEGIRAASHGVDFLREFLWDRDQGGFFWSVSHDGSSVTDSSKRLYANSFALYGLAEYARASQEAGALEYTHEVADLFRGPFHDPVHGGYLSELNRSLQPVPIDGPRGGTVRHKTVNEHLHVLEALEACAHLRSETWVRDHLNHLILILTGSALRKTIGTNSDRHRPDWTPLLGREHAKVSYGHDAEAVWLVSEACRVTGVPFFLVADWARSLMASVLRWGWDRRKGGVYYSGPLGGPAHSRQKVWWVQAEVLVGALTAYRLMGDARFAELYLNTLDWIKEYHVDWKGGEWRSTVEPDGSVSGDRAGLWKSPYHNGRAMIRCLELLKPGSPDGLEAAGGHGSGPREV